MRKSAAAARTPAALRPALSRCAERAPVRRALLCAQVLPMLGPYSVPQPGEQSDATRAMDVIFDAIDDNGNGLIEYRELAASLRTTSWTLGDRPELVPINKVRAHTCAWVRATVCVAARMCPCVTWQCMHMRAPAARCAVSVGRPAVCARTSPGPYLP